MVQAGTTALLTAWRTVGWGDGQAGLPPFRRLVQFR